MTDQQKTEISSQVSDLIQQFIASGQIGDLDPIVSAVVYSWDPAGGRDADKWLVSGFHNVRAIARAVIRQYDVGNDDDVDDRQIDLFPNYTKLQRAYLIPGGERKGKIVPAELMTVAEALAIIEQHDRAISGRALHKNELLRFIDEVLIPRQNGN